MHKIREIIRNISNSTKEILFFGSIFTIFFCSSAGISNTIDGPQYFSTEMLLRNGNVDLAPAKKFGHFFYKNDIAFQGDRLFTIRGYAHSIFSFPLHIIAYPLQKYVNTTSYPKYVAMDPNFAHELLTCSLFSIFSVAGLYFLYLAIKSSTNLGRLSYLIIFFTAFGTYIWKYSGFYVRQGLLVFIFGFSLFALQRSLGGGRYKNHFTYIFVFLFASLFGFDIPGIVAFVATSLLIGAIYLINRLYVSKKSIPSKYIKPLVTSLCLFFLILGLNVLFNKIFLNSFYHVLATPIFEKYTPLSSSFKFLSGTPIFPTIWWILFGSSPLPLESLEKLFINQQYVDMLSVRYAMKYNFFGIFAISPFLLFAFLPIPQILSAAKFDKRLFESKYLAIFWCVAYSAIYTVISIKNFGFYAANSYDIRYFYPLAIYLAYLTALSLNYILKNFDNRKIFLYVFAVLGAFSVVMGAIGIMNAYGTYMGAERRIWVEIHNLHLLFGLPAYEVLNAILPNIRNAIFPISLTAIVAVAQYTVSKISSKR